MQVSGHSCRGRCPHRPKSERLCICSKTPRDFRRWFLRRQCSCLGKNIEKKPTQGALPKSRPLENPPAAPPEVHQNISDCYKGMAATGNHQYSRSTTPEGKAWRTDCDRRESLERATPVCATLRYDCHWQSLLF